MGAVSIFKKETLIKFLETQDNIGIFNEYTFIYLCEILCN